MHQINIERMFQTITRNTGFDVIIVVSSDTSQAEFWQERLEDSREQVISPKTRIISVDEDWLGGAGQLLGTLYAFDKVSGKIDLAGILKNKGSVALYHTAGKGMRMAPIPAAEINNKSAINLPRMIDVNGTNSMLTVLEAVIFQTGIFAASRKGRLCVFWGDQVFIPSKSAEFHGESLAEILAVDEVIPEYEATWVKNWQSYGLIITNSRGETIQREKQSWQQLQQLIEQGTILPGDDKKIVLGKSLGCFSVSEGFLYALLNEFSQELKEKKIRLDTDPHLWMPLTSTREEFIASGGDEVLWIRLDRLKMSLMESTQNPFRMLSQTDVGQKTYWWDYGQKQLYFQNSLKLLEQSKEGACLRQFYQLEEFYIEREEIDGLLIENSIIMNRNVTGTIKDSVIIDVEADYLAVSGTVIFNSRLTRASVNDALIYRCVDFSDLTAANKSVNVNVTLPSTGMIRLETEFARDGKEDWDHIIEKNQYTYGQLNGLIQNESRQGIIAEREKWMAYYNRKESICQLIERCRNGFIKPETDNLVELVWGGDRIEKMKGLSPSGRRIGESWECSAHPSHPSMVMCQDDVKIQLNDLISMAGDDILGRQILAEFKGKLPILVKFIDAKENLSVQGHPSDNQVFELGEYETGKTELWIVLEADADAVLYLGFKKDVDPAVFAKNLKRSDVNVAEEFMNAYRVKVGDVIFNPSGTIHAIGKGLLMAEVQQSSGITYRLWDWNRRPARPLHIEKGLQSLDFRKSEITDFIQTPKKMDNKSERIADNLHFTVDRLILSVGDEIAILAEDSFHVLTCLEGTVELKGQSSTEQLDCGQSVLVPAAMSQYTIRAQGKSVILKSFVQTNRLPDL